MENDELINKKDEEKLEPAQDQFDEPSQDASQEQFEESENEIEPSTDNTVEEPSDLHIPPVIKEVPEVKKMPEWLRNGLIFAGVGILLLLVGYLISFFTATIPAQNAYQTILQELNNKDNDLINLQAQFNQASEDLQNTQNNLNRIELDYQTLEQNHQKLIANSEFNQTLIDMKYEIGLARFALLNKDPLSARQAISLARDQFEKIRNLLDADISTGIQDRLQGIQKLFSTDPEEALDELRTLSENLERIPLK